MRKHAGSGAGKSKVDVPADFIRAYEDLVALVERIDAGEVTDGLVREEVDYWRGIACRGSAALTKAAILALRHELATEGLEHQREGNWPAAGSSADKLEVLARVEHTLSSPKPSEGEEKEPEIVEVALPETLRGRMPNARCFRMGELRIIFNQTQGPPYGQLSISHPERYPTWEEILHARTAPGGVTPNLFVLVPKEAMAEADNGDTRPLQIYIAPPVELMG